MLVYVPHKMRNYAFLLRSRAKQKYTNKCDARAKLLFCLLNLLFFPRSRCPPYRRIDVNCQNWPIIVYRVFPLTWPASTQIYWNRRKSLHKNIIQLPQDGLGHQRGRRFIVLRHQYGRRDVMWKHSVPGAGLSEWDFENNGRFPFDQNVRIEFSAISSSKWNSIFKNFQHSAQTREEYPNFRKFFPVVFFPFNFALGISRIFNWMVRISEI